MQTRILLHHNVPRFIKHIKDRGGVQQEEWDWMQREDEDPDCPMGLFSRADELLLFPKDEETFKNSLVILVTCLAIMSFIPGGVRFADLQFSTEIDGFVVDESTT